ncbi:MAG: hypothetical protein DRP30_07515 [Thermotoga sp.]|nr:MAG: hypothetical protein DRP30_07515 [Thermotoga sp.]
MTVATLGKIGDPAKPVNVSKNITEMALEPAQIYEYDEITEEDVLTQVFDPSVLVIEGVADVEKSKAYLYTTKMEGLKKRIARRIELMFAQIISQGKITYDDGERKYEVDFNITPETYDLSASTEGVYNDLQDFMDEMRKKGHAPTIMLMTKSVHNTLMKNDDWLEYLDKNKLNLGRAVMTTNTNVRRTFDIVDFPEMYIYFGEYKDGATTKKYIEGDKIILIDPSVFRLAYGAIVDFTKGEQGKVVQTDVMVWTETPERTRKLLKVLSRPLPYVVSPEGVKIINVNLS